MVDINQKIEKTGENIEKQPNINPEIVKTPEKEAVIEDMYEKIEGNQDKLLEESKSQGEKAGIVQASQAQSDYVKRQKAIENILEKGLDEEFLKMPKDKQLEFKRVGEETSIKINVMLDSGKAKARKIIDLIKKWLNMIPGINKFFVEQESKIKADEAMKLE